MSRSFTIEETATSKTSPFPYFVAVCKNCGWRSKIHRFAMGAKLSGEHHEKSCGAAA